jgi:hypothetical protein
MTREQRFEKCESRRAFCPDFRTHMVGAVGARAYSASQTIPYRASSTEKDGPR